MFIFRIIFYCIFVITFSNAAFAKNVKIAILSELPGADLDSPNYLKDIPAACQMAIDDQSEALKKCGIKINLSLKQIDVDPLAPFKALKSVYDSDALAAVGFQSSDEVAVAGKVIKNTDFLAISPYASASNLKQFMPNYLSLVANNKELAKKTEYFIQHDLKPKKIVAIVAWDSPFSRDFYQSLSEKFKRKTKLYKIWDKIHDFESNIQKIKAESPEVVLLPNFPVNTAYVIKALSKAGLNTIFVGPDSWGEGDSRFTRILQGIHFKGYTIRQFSDFYMDKRQKDLSSRFKRTYKRNFSTVAGLYYDATSYVIKLILELHGRVDRRTIFKQSKIDRSLIGVMGTHCISNEVCKKRRFLLISADETGFRFKKILQ